MSNYINLLGAEDVSRAGYSIQSAAQEMARAAGYIDSSLREQRQFMDDWLMRFEAALNRVAPLPTRPHGGGRKQIDHSENNE